LEIVRVNLTFSLIGLYMRLGGCNIMGRARYWIWIGHLPLFIFKDINVISTQIKGSQSISFNRPIKTESWLKVEMLQFSLYIPDYALQKMSSNTQHSKYSQLIFYTIIIIFYDLTDLIVVRVSSQEEQLPTFPEGWITRVWREILMSSSRFRLTSSRREHLAPTVG